MMILDDTATIITTDEPETTPDIMEIKQRVRDELSIIRSRHAAITPDDVLAFAENPETALHTQFNWDDSEAAHKYRLWQARQLLRAYITVVDRGDGEKAPSRAFVSVQKSEVSERGYVPTQEILSDTERRRDLVIAQVERISSILKSYPLVELQPIAEAVEKVRAGLG
jgi:hypothetical protein